MLGWAVLLSYITVNWLTLDFWGNGRRLSKWNDPIKLKEKVECKAWSTLLLLLLYPQHDKQLQHRKTASKSKLLLKIDFICLQNHQTIPDRRWLCSFHSHKHILINNHAINTHYKVWILFSDAQQTRF